MANADVVIPTVDLDQVADFASAVLAFGDTLSTVTGLDSWGPVVEDKDTLCGVPFIIVRWKFHEGNFGPYVAALIITETNEKLVITDGSSGVYAQLRALTDDTNRTEGLMASRGLRRSDYEVNGRAARTYYLAG